MATAKKAARKSSARKATSRSGAKAKPAKAEKGAKARSPNSVDLVDGDRAADPTVGKNVAKSVAATGTKRSSRDAVNDAAVASGAKGRSIPAGTTTESQRRGSGNPPGPITTDADRKALADREKLEASRATAQ